MNPATATRLEIREFVRLRDEEMRRIISSGGNSNHFLIDQKESLEAMLSDLSYEQRSKFMDIYVEELEAHLDHIEKNPPPIPPAPVNPQMAALEKSIGTSLIGLVLAVAILIIGVYMMTR